MSLVYPNPYYAPWGSSNSSDSAPSFPEEVDVGDKTGADDIDLSESLNQKITLTGNTTLTIDGLVADRSQWFQLKVEQGGAGSFTLAIVGALTPGGLGLSLSGAVGAEDMISGYWDGTVIYAQVAGLAFS